MRSLLTIAIVVFGVAELAHSETLYLNTAQSRTFDAPQYRTLNTASTSTKTLTTAPAPSFNTPSTQTLDTNSPATRDTQTAAVGHDDGHPVGYAPEHHDGRYCAECQSGGGHRGSLGRYPGGCCEDDGRCCASLWENYCRDKRPCWSPESPRRHATGFGIPIPTLPKLHLLHRVRFKGFGHKRAVCDGGLTCDYDSSLASIGGTTNASPDAADEPAPPTTIPDDDVDAAGDVQPTPPPVDAASARKSKLPFGWKLSPLSKPSNPFRNLPTAGIKLPFSR